jgi:hypothetical protein
VVIDGISFAALDIGFAWSDPDEAIADAKSHIDRFGLSARTVSMPHIETRTMPASGAGVMSHAARNAAPALW